jgi:hypothetical protein
VYNQTVPSTKGENKVATKKNTPEVPVDPKPETPATDNPTDPKPENFTFFVGEVPPDNEDDFDEECPIYDDVPVHITFRNCSNFTLNIGNSNAE